MRRARLCFVAGRVDGVEARRWRLGRLRNKLYRQAAGRLRTRRRGKRDAGNTPSLDELVRQRVADVDDARAAQRVAQPVARLEPHRPFLADGFPSPAPGHVVAGVALAVAAHLGLVEVGRVAQEPAVEGRRQRVVAHPCAEVGPRSRRRQRGQQRAEPRRRCGAAPRRSHGRLAGHFWWAGPAVAPRADALPTGRIDGPEESCGRAVQFWLRAGEIHNRFCGLMCQKFFDEFWRRVVATESPLYGTSTAYRLRRRMSRTNFAASVCISVVVHRAALRVTARTPGRQNSSTARRLHPDNDAAAPARRTAPASLQQHAHAPGRSLTAQHRWARGGGRRAAAVVAGA